MFTFEPGVAIWTLISFIIVLTVLWKLAYPPVRKILDERKDTIEFALSESKKNREEAQKMFSEAEEKLHGVKLEAHRIVSEAQSKGQQMLSDYEKKALDEYRNLRRQKELELEATEKDFLRSIEEHVANLVVKACHKIIDVDLTQEQKDAVIKKRIEELEDLKKL